MIFKNIISGRTYPEAGSLLFASIKEAISQKQVLAIDMEEIISIPTVFMNTAFGAIIDIFGAEVLKGTIKFKNISKTQAIRILEYIDDYERIINKGDDALVKEQVGKKYLTNETLMKSALVETAYNFKGQTAVYHGKVRDVYSIGDDLLVMIATDRISAFDVVLPEGIPYKGQVLNQIASKFLDATQDILPNWKLATPDPMVTVGLKCEPYKIEMVIRGYLTGSAWREYKAGNRTICGITLPEGMKENEKFPLPIITPTTKADEGHDENISREEIISQGIIDEKEYIELEKYTYALFARGTEIAKEKGLILVDTKYEFGKREDRIYLIDEIHTPDSSRYFHANTYSKLFAEGKEQKQLSKEFVRKWLIDNGFQGKDGQKVPTMSAEYCEEVAERYIELYEYIIGEKFVKATSENIVERIKINIDNYLESDL